MQWRLQSRAARSAIKRNAMARPIVDSARPGSLLSPDRSSAPRLADGGIAIAALAAVASALLYELAAAEPRLWPCALLAPLPILATAPEIRTSVGAQLAFIAYLVGNIVAWGGE